MMRPVLGTIASRMVVMAFTLLTIMVAGHRLGTDGLGTISLIVLGITFILLLNNVVGGGALVYLAPRHPRRALLVPAYLWALFTAMVAGVVLQVVPLVPPRFITHVVLLALLQGITTIHFGFLLGNQRIRVFNLIVGAQAAVHFMGFTALVLLQPDADALAYVQAGYVAYGSAVLLSTLALRGVPSGAPDGEQQAIWRVLFGHGGLIQLANLLQLLNYRVAYYLIEALRGTSALGLYAVANQLAESAWLAPKSLGTVLYSKLSNTDERDRQRDLTLTVAKVAVAFSALVVGLLLLVPEPFFRLLFGAEVLGLPALVLLLAPGIVGMSASQAFSHYFSGTGRNVHNVLGSGIGLVITLAVGLLLIPRHGLEGAALTASLAYCGNALYQLLVFLRCTDTHPRMLLYTADDGLRLQRLWKAVWGNRNGAA